ncbi:MAG: hypothetical protein JJ959_12315 [Nisaea sp.]|uniref:hypothetical protein n=1 Tax=Nisaea sp. TaxID=2024842 RepID=UPI001B22F498|nr:hypothetical protein [Nisaea sp.]MBO6561318.1 hypothetical protein [Nisaea sp.]
MWRLTIIALLLFGIPSQASAGAYTDKAARCLVVSTLKSERADLVLWMFLTMRDHPALNELPKQPDSVVEISNRKTASLITELISDRCVEEFREARKHDGQESWKASFAILGQIAGEELVAHPHVQKSLQGFAEFIDLEKINEALTD